MSQSHQSAYSMIKPSFGGMSVKLLEKLIEGIGDRATVTPITWGRKGSCLSKRRIGAKVRASASSSLFKCPLVGRTGSSRGTERHGSLLIYAVYYQTRFILAGDRLLAHAVNPDDDQIEPHG